tara:strand:- start:424 stop:531 length:108 start_codon:yes stop_codon:yes gene_type:complete
MCRSAITPMKKQGEGIILNIGSISGLLLIIIIVFD